MGLWGAALCLALLRAELCKNTLFSHLGFHRQCGIWLFVMKKQSPFCHERAGRDMLLCSPRPDLQNPESMKGEEMSKQTRGRDQITKAHVCAWGRGWGRIMRSLAMSEISIWHWEQWGGKTSHQALWQAGSGVGYPLCGWEHTPSSLWSRLGEGSWGWPPLGEVGWVLSWALGELLALVSVLPSHFHS